MLLFWQTYADWLLTMSGVLVEALSDDSDVSFILQDPTGALLPGAHLAVCSVCMAATSLAGVIATLAANLMTFLNFMIAMELNDLLQVTNALEGVVSTLIVLKTNFETVFIALLDAAVMMLVNTMETASLDLNVSVRPQELSNAAGAAVASLAAGGPESAAAIQRGALAGFAALRGADLAPAEAGRAALTALASAFASADVPATIAIETAQMLVDGLAAFERGLDGNAMLSGSAWGIGLLSLVMFLAFGSAIIGQAIALHDAVIESTIHARSG
jgi:hypothetical protein